MVDKFNLARFCAVNFLWIFYEWQKHPALLQGVRIVVLIQLSLKFNVHAGFEFKDKNQLWFTWTSPFWYRNWSPILTFLERDSDSCCAREAIMVSSTSPLESIVLMFSFSKNTGTFFSFSCLMYLRQSRVFLANRLIDFVIIMSIFSQQYYALHVRFLGYFKHYVENSKKPMFTCIFTIIHTYFKTNLLII